MCRKPSLHGSGRPGFPVKKVVPNEYGNYAIFLIGKRILDFGPISK